MIPAWRYPSSALRKVFWTNTRLELRKGQLLATPDRFPDVAGAELFPRVAYDQQARNYGCEQMMRESRFRFGFLPVMTPLQSSKYG